LALVGSFELLMMLIRAVRGTRGGDAEPKPRYQPTPPLAQEAPLVLSVAPTLEQTVHVRHKEGHSTRALLWADILFTPDRRQIDALPCFLPVQGTADRSPVDEGAYYPRC